MTDNGNGPRLVRLGVRPSISHSQYEAYLARAITESSPHLLEIDTWDRGLLLDCLGKSLPAPAQKALVSVEHILRAIRANQEYSGTENRYRRPSS